MSDTQMVIKFENLPNEILIECFNYFHTLDLRHSFGQLNHRLEQLRQTLPWRLNFEGVKRETYDALCQDMLRNPDIQQRICSLRLSDQNTPGLIDDFFSKFSVDEFSHLRSLTFLDLPRTRNWRLIETLPKLTQITALNIYDSDMLYSDRHKYRIPIDNLQTLAIHSRLHFVNEIISMKSLKLDYLSLNDIIGLFQYTPLLRYFKVSYIPADNFKAEYHQSPRPHHLTHLNLGHFSSTFDDLIHFLQNMSNLRSLTIDYRKDKSIMDASHWEELITFVLPHLKDFRFTLTLNRYLDKSKALAIFNRFQTNFWLQEHQWYTECSVHTKYTMVYTIPWAANDKDIHFGSKRYCNPLIDKSKTFEHVKELCVSARDVFKPTKYHFPNLTSLIILKTPDIFMEDDEEQMIESPMKPMDFSHLKHLKIDLDCQIERTSILFRILDLAPHLSSLSTNQCLFESMSKKPESHRYLNGKIRILDIRKRCRLWNCRKQVSISTLYQVLPDLEQLTTRKISIDDLFFLLHRFSKLSVFRIRVSSFDPIYERFKM